MEISAGRRQVTAVTTSNEHPARGKRERTSIRVVLVDDDASDRERVAAIVRSDVAPVEIVDVDDHVSFFQTLKKPDFDLVITEQDLHWSSGQEVLTAVKSLQPTIPVIMVARSENEAIAAAALKEGVDAYIPKSGELAIRLRSSVRSALQKLEFEQRAETLESRLKSLLDRLDVGVFRSAADGRILEANSALLRIIGVKTLKSAGGIRFRDLFVNRADYAELLSRLEVEGEVRDFQIEIQRSDGSRKWVSLTETNQLRQGGERVIDGLMEDATASREAREALRRASDDYRAIFETTNAGIVVLDADDTVAIANTAFEQMSGYSLREIEGVTKWGDFIATADRDRFLSQLHEVFRGGASAPKTSRFDFVNRSGRSLHVLATMAPLPGSGRLVISLLNLTERQRAEEQVLHNAFHDGLTGLPNRLSLLDRMETLIGRKAEGGSERFALILIGLDRFRVVNESLGHRTGDLLLQAVARRLEGVLKDVDTIARCSGDVFGVIVGPVTGVDWATASVAVVSEALANPFNFGDQTVHCSASFGVVLSDSADDANELYRDAEAAMYEAKRTDPGKCLVYEAEMHERARLEFVVENDLRRAMVKRELHTHFQPIASLADGTIVGFEALLRWQRTGGEVRFPGDFLDVAETTGLIVPIGRAVLRDACDKLGRWESGGGSRDSLFVSVNLSRRQLHHPQLVDQIRLALADSGLEPRNLMLEVSQGVLTGDSEANAAVLGRLHGLGVQLCLDGFGTGESSLAVLHSFPFSTVKIDRSFLTEIGDDSARWRLLDGVHALALHLGLKAIVVGIEERSQLHRLLDLGCTLGQGMLLSPAVDDERALKMLAAHPVW